MSDSAKILEGIPIEAWTDAYADTLRNNIVAELLQKGLKNQEMEECTRHIMIFIRQWLRDLENET